MMPRPPRLLDQVHPVCVKLIQLLNNDAYDPTKEELLKVLSAIMDDNYSSYVPPKKGALVPGSRDFITLIMEKKPNTHILMVEQCNIQDYANSSVANQEWLKYEIPDWDDPT